MICVSLALFAIGITLYPLISNYFAEVNRSLIETMDELNKIQSEGRAKRAAAETGQSRNDLYHAALVREKESGAEE